MQAIGLACAVAGIAVEAKIALLVDLRPEEATIDSGKDQWDDPERSDDSSFVDLTGRIQTASPRAGSHGGQRASRLRPMGRGRGRRRCRSRILDIGTGPSEAHAAFGKQ